MNRIVVALVLVCACSKKAKEITPASSEQCTEAVGRSVDIGLTARKKQLETARAAKGIPVNPDANQAMVEHGVRMKTALVARCVEDKWGTAVAQCFNTAQNIADCEKGLSREQLASYRSAMSRAMVMPPPENRLGPRGLPGMPGVPGPRAPMPGSAGSALPPTAMPGSAGSPFPPPAPEGSAGGPPPRRPPAPMGSK